MTSRPKGASDHRAMRRLARILVGVFFRRLEVAGASSLPDSGPVVLVANHSNGLVDGIVLMAGLARYPRFLGKSTLWKIVPLRPLLALAGVIPVYRASETSGASRSEGNAAAFTASRDVLARGAVIAIFPEGISHDEPVLQELRSGAARIALDAGAPVVAAGIVYDDKSRFRSSALVRLGPSRAVTGGDSRSVTADLAADLAVVAPSWDSWSSASRLMDLAALAVGPESLASRDEAARALALRSPEVTAELSEELAALSARAAVVGLRLSDLGGSRRGIRARFTVGVLGTVVTLPGALVGAAVHAGPYALIKLLSRRPDNIGMRATVKVGGSLGLYVLLYAGIGVAVGRRRGPLAGLAAAGAAPLTGWCTVLAGERLDDLGGLARVGEVVRRDRRGLAALDRDYAALGSRVRALLG